MVPTMQGSCETDENWPRYCCLRSFAIIQTLSCLDETLDGELCREMSRPREIGFTVPTLFGTLRMDEHGVRYEHSRLLLSMQQ